MTYSLPAVEDYNRLIPVARMIYEHTSKLSWEMLLPLFLVSIAMSYTTDLGIYGAVLVRLKRLILVALLLVSFSTIAEFCQAFGVEIAKSLDDMSGIDAILQASAQKAGVFSFSIQALMNLKYDLVVGFLVIVSFIILVAARFFLLAFQHFYWLLLISLGPFLILGMLFDSASGMTKNLFKNIFLVSSWPVIWAVLSAFLKALPFASVYTNSDGELITIVTMNLIIAVALLFSPFLISQICEGVSLSIGDTLRRGVLNTVAMVSPKARAAAALVKGASAAAKGTQRFSR